jgi:hypothetical protein
MEKNYKAAWFALKGILEKLKEKNWFYFENLDETLWENKKDEVKKDKDLIENNYLNMQRGYYCNASKDILKEMEGLEKELFKKAKLEKDKEEKEIKKGYNFKGWDWEELTTALGVEQPEMEYDKDPFSNIRAQRIKEYVYSLKEEERKVAIKLMRKFLKKLVMDAEKNKMSMPSLVIWKDLVKLKEDDDFCYIFLALLETLWT